jgi:hypothetical protein
VLGGGQGQNGIPRAPTFPFGTPHPLPDPPQDRAPRQKERNQNGLQFSIKALKSNQSFFCNEILNYEKKLTTY